MVRAIILVINPCSFLLIRMFCLAVMTRGIIHIVKMISMFDMWSREHILLILLGRIEAYLINTVGRIMYVINSMA